MTTLAPERVDELVVDLRRGFDVDGMANPAGPMFPDSFREHEITMTGGGGGGGHTDPVTTNWTQLDNCLVMCCIC